MKFDINVKHLWVVTSFDIQKHDRRQSVNFNWLWSDVHVFWTKYLECWVDEWQHCVLQRDGRCGQVSLLLSCAIDINNWKRKKLILLNKPTHCWRTILPSMDSIPFMFHLKCASHITYQHIIHRNILHSTTFFTSICKFH